MSAGGRSRMAPAVARAAALSALFAAGLAGCEGKSATPAPPAPAAASAPEADAAAARDRAEKAAGRLVTAVMGELTKALAEGPPERALHVCADAAQAVSARAAAEEGLYVKRTAIKLRNPKNAPDDHERRVLEEWMKGLPATATARAEVVAAPDGGRELRFLRPIVLQPLCTGCHGPAQEIPERVRAALAERYPNDRATGFRPGDLRGAVSVRVPIGRDD